MKPLIRFLSTSIRKLPLSREFSHSLSSSRHTTRKMTTRIQPQFASTYPSTTGLKDLETLLKPRGKWSLTKDGRGLERAFKFKGFKRCWEFMNHVSAECIKQKHHPEWSNVYNTAFVRWTTHVPLGLSEKDVVMARICDGVAGEVGEVEVVEESRADGEEGPGEAVNVREELVNRVVKVGGDCCVPPAKKKEAKGAE